MTDYRRFTCWWCNTTGSAHEIKEHRLWCKPPRAGKEGLTDERT